jgi:protein-tyrosine phosphatase
LKHFHYKGWPDYGVPSTASELIEFCKMIRSERKKQDGIVIAHCRLENLLKFKENFVNFLFQSAGVGRTGTFIALDIMIQRMKKEKKIVIFEMVKRLRSQRIRMVQSEEQYIFLYKSALELTES